MPNIAGRNLQGESYERLFQRFLNAVGLLVSDRRTKEAQGMITDIQREWRRRRDRSDPVLDYDRPEQGVLGALGYHVGHTQGKSSGVRRMVLKYVLEGELPMIHSVSDMNEWGKPNSLRRFEKSARVLTNMIEGNQRIRTAN